MPTGREPDVSPSTRTPLRLGGAALRADGRSARLALPRQTKATRDAFRPVLTCLGAVCLGFAIGVSPTVVAALVGLALLAVGVLQYPVSTCRWIVGLAVALPVGWNVAVVLPVEVGLLGVTVPLPTLLIVATSGLTVAFAVGSRSHHIWRVPRAARYVLAAVAVWLAVGLSLSVLGLSQHGVLAALRDTQYVLLWSWCVVVAAAAGGRTSFPVESGVRAILIGCAAYGAISLGLYLAPEAVRLRVFESAVDTYAGSSRVGFGNGSVFVLALPLLVALVAVSREARGSRWLFGIAGVTMLAALAVSQSRTVIVLGLLNCAIAWLMVGAPGLPSRRDRVFVFALVTVGLVAALAGILNAAGVQDVARLPGELADRLSTLTSVREDSNVQTRITTVSAAVREAGSRSETLLFGRGLGAEVSLYSPRGVYLGQQQFVDNVWAVLLAKGGLVAVSVFAGMLGAFGVVLVRAAREATAGSGRVIWRVVAASYPALVLATTLPTRHLFATPAVIVTLTTLVTLAAFEPVERRTVRNRASALE